MSNFSTPLRPGSKCKFSSIDLLTKTNVNVKGGAQVATDSTGYCLEATNASGLMYWGKAENGFDNTTSLNGGPGPNGGPMINGRPSGVVKVLLAHAIECQLWENDISGTPVTQAMIGTQVRMIDNQTVSGGSTGSLGPYVYAVDAEGVWCTRNF